MHCLLNRQALKTKIHSENKNSLTLWLLIVAVIILLSHLFKDYDDDRCYGNDFE